MFKITLSIVIAGYLYDYGSDLNKTRFLIPVPPLHSLGPLVLLWVTPLLFLVFIHDFGQLLLYSVLAVIMIFYASKRFAYIFISLFILITFTVVILNFSDYLPGDLKYINKRFDTWANFWDEFPAVTVPLGLKAGRIVELLSLVVPGRIPSSVSNMNSSS